MFSADSRGTGDLLLRAELSLGTEQQPEQATHGGTEQQPELATREGTEQQPEPATCVASFSLTLLYMPSTFQVSNFLIFNQN